MSDIRPVQSRTKPRNATPGGPAAAATAALPRSADTEIAVEIRTAVEQGAMETARERFGGIVVIHQRRALRIALQYLRDAADADDAVQDAFIKAFTHIGSYRDVWPFEVWFTRILINGCLDRRKSRARRSRWLVPSFDGGLPEPAPAKGAGGSATDPEGRLIQRERREQIAAAVDRLEGRQRSVFMLCHYGDCSPREISEMTGINESTVRVHLFRAARKLRALLGGHP